jgi:hypothetical protein
MRSRLIHAIIVMHALAGEIHKELASCDDVQVAPLRNALRELEEFRHLCSNAFQRSRDMDDELAERVMPELIAESDRMIALSRLALMQRRLQ